jgi:chromosome segregation ATPase
MGDDAKNFQRKLEDISEVNQKLERENEQLRMRLNRLVQENKEESLKYIELQERFSYEIDKLEVERRDQFEKFKNVQEKLQNDIAKLTEENTQTQNQKAEFIEKINGFEKKYSSNIPTLIFLISRFD